MFGEDATNEIHLQQLPWYGACAVDLEHDGVPWEGGKGGRPRREAPGQEEEKFY